MIYFLAKYVEMKQKKMRVETGRKCPTQYISVLQVVAIEGTIRFIRTLFTDQQQLRTMEMNMRGNWENFVIVCA